jgi:3D-(3,5/4)-trihydroxycyclohexane-1,2-dione acylhydrolase (decyclizing)
LQDFTTGSWSVFRNPALRLVMLNVAPHDAVKHLALPLVADAGRGLDELGGALADWQAPAEWLGRGQELYRVWNAYLDEAAAPPAPGMPPSYQAVVRVVNDHVEESDYVVAAAGGLPGELNKGWRSVGVGTFDCEYGFSCMGYEIGGAWGAAMAKVGEGSGTVISFCGDGSYLMANSELYSSVLSGHPFVLVLCDNGGYAVIDRLQTSKGSASFNNMLEDTRHRELVRVDFAKHAAALGAWVEEVASLDALPEALARAVDAGRTAVLVVATDPHRWTGGDAWWDVGVPEVSDREQVLVAKAEHEAERKHQRIGV